jgi:hypothetical protein
VPVSRFLCEHLPDELIVIEACISRIHAQDPVVTTGDLSHPLMQDVACGIDVAIVVRSALGTAPFPLIEPQLIEHVPTAARATGAGIACTALSVCCLSSPPRGGLILGYGGVAAGSVDESVRKLANVVVSHSLPTSDATTNRMRRRA